MDGFGCIHCFLVATKAGEVIYERCYERFTEVEKSEIRSAFQQATDTISLQQDDQDFVGSYKTGQFVFIPTTDLIFYCLGSGEYDEMALVSLLRLVIASIKDVVGKPPTESVLFEKYSKLCLVLDEIINEGLLETTDVAAIRKGTKHKGAWE